MPARQNALYKLSITKNYLFSLIPPVDYNANLIPKGEQIVNNHGWKTRGAKILDEYGKEVNIRGVSWFGMETENFAPEGLDVRSADSMLAQMKKLGFNTLRLPYSDECLYPEVRASNINADLNPDYAGKTCVEIMDLTVKKAGEHGLKVMLDRHRPDSLAQAELGWTTSRVSEDIWISNLVTLAQRYIGNPTVVAMELSNEPHSNGDDQLCWGGGGDLDWKDAAQKAGNAVLKINPDLLIIVDGIDVYNHYWNWWGGNLMGVRNDPVMLKIPGKVVYSVHEYPSSIYPQPWLSEPSSYQDTLPDRWDRMWGYLVKTDTAPVILTEFGTRLEEKSDMEWLKILLRYLLVNGMGWMWWSWNPTSHDTGGLLDDDWETVVSNKYRMLKPLLGQK